MPICYAEALADKTCGGVGYRVGGTSLPEMPNWVAAGVGGDSGGLVNGIFGADGSGLGGASFLPPQKSSVWNGMVSPLTRMRIAGVAWYQGEANIARYATYACHFPAMISDWRRRFNQPLVGVGDVNTSSAGSVSSVKSSKTPTPLPLTAFVYVEIAPDYGPRSASNTGLTRIRQAQSAALQLPGVARVASIDQGDAAAGPPLLPLHPRRKVEIGRR